MRESKAELTDRLRSEGRWEAFRKRREELKAGGMAAADAWNAAKVEFPPPNGRQRNGETSKVDLGALRGKPAVSVAQAAAWVFEYLDADWIIPADAPSAGAWSLREWAQSSLAARGDFYRLFATKSVMQMQGKTRQAETDDDVYDRAVAERLFGPGTGDPKAEREEEQRYDGRSDRDWRAR